VPSSICRYPYIPPSNVEQLRRRVWFDPRKLQKPSISRSRNLRYDDIAAQPVRYSSSCWPFTRSPMARILVSARSASSSPTLGCCWIDHVIAAARQGHEHKLTRSEVLATRCLELYPKQKLLLKIQRNHLQRYGVERLI
jgi:hypothetical protein